MWFNYTILINKINSLGMNRIEYEKFISKSSEEVLQFSKGRDDTCFTLGRRVVWSNVLFVQEMCLDRNRASAGASTNTPGII